MAIPNWTAELLRRSINEVADRARQPETLDKIKSQATEILQDLPASAARGLDAVIRSADTVMRSAESSGKAVERWARKHTQLAIPMINAGGTLLTRHGTGIALDRPVQQVGIEILAGDSLGGVALDDRLNQRLKRLAPGNIDDNNIVVATSLDAAIASLATFSASRTLAVHRSNCVRLPSGQSLPSALSSIGVSLAGLHPAVREVGSSNHRCPEDFDEIEKACVVIADGGDEPIEPFRLSAKDAIQVAILPVCSWGSLEGISRSVPNLSRWIDQVDLLIVPGGGLLGGPDCGILIGKSELLDEITGGPAWPALRGSVATKAMATVALESASDAKSSSAIIRRIETSEENLKGRAERLATRLSGSDSITSCQITADDAKITESGRWRIASRQICIRLTSGSADKWADRLAEDIPAVLTVHDNDFVKLDLRWVDPADDSKLAEAIGAEFADSEPADSIVGEPSEDG